MDVIRIGVMGVGRGTSMIRYCKEAKNARLVAICDCWEEGLLAKKAELGEDGISYYTDFEDFIKHDMDAVVLANFATEHAPFAIRCMEAGKHVFSEVLPVQTLAEAVELIECVERTGMTYAYGENYCYMEGPREMRRLLQAGKLGEFQYGEGEYLHNCEDIWPRITQGDPDHWRNHMYATFYCTHSLGPLIHISGLRPVSVVGFETPRDVRGERCGYLAGMSGIEMVTLENGAVVKSHHGMPSRNSVWYSVYGSKGTMETAREITEKGFNTLYTNFSETDTDNGNHLNCYDPKSPEGEGAGDYGHGNSDYYAMYHFVEKLRGNPEAEVIDVYEALDMFLPGLLAYRSILAGNLPIAIPNLRDPAEREKYRNDRACVDPKVAGDQVIPSYSKGNAPVDPGVYDRIRALWEASPKDKA